MQDLALTVEDVAAGGDGIARAEDGRVVFVRGAVPGDRVDVRVVREKKRMVHADATAVLEASPDRVEPPCPHVARGCGGCGWQHIHPDAQIRWKVRLVEESLRRIGGVADAEGSVAVGPPLATAGFRTTIRCLVTAEGLALRGARSHDAVPIDSCLVLHPALEALVADTGPWAAVAEHLDEVTLRVSTATGARVVVCDPGVPAGLHLPADVQVVGRDDLRRGRSVHFHEVVDGVRMRVSARSFFQTRTDGAEALVAAVRSAGEGRWGSGAVVDLYGGVGLFAATLGASMAATVVESSASSVADARTNLPDAHVVASPVESWRPAAGAEVPAIVVADPPRAGLGRDGVDAVASTGADALVLVSCDAAAFGRDAGLLADAGWVRSCTTLVDLFPHTHHVELVSRFDRKVPRNPNDH